MSDQPKGLLSDRIAQTQIHRLKQALQSAEQAIAIKHPVDLALRQYMGRNRSLGSRDRRLIRDTLFCYYRWKPWLLTIEEERSQPDTAIYLAGVLGHSKTPPAIIALGESLGLTIPADESSSDLETVKKILQPLTETTLTNDQLFPTWFASVLAPDLQSESSDTWLSRPPTWLRMLNSKTPAVLDAFRIRKISEPKPHPEMPNTFRVTQNFAEQSLIKASEGGFLIQDIASQVVVDLCRDLPVTRWWDACCGAGGKTIALADDGSRSVFASDMRSTATRKLHDRRREYPNLNIKVASLNASNEVPNDGLYEGVLLDAPCTGQGTWGRNPDLRWRTDEQDLQKRVGEQQALLNNCAQAVAPSGYLVYSICSLTQTETTEVIKDFLSKHPDFQALGVTHALLPRHWENGVCILPSSGPGNGMFISVLQRTKEP